MRLEGRDTSLCLLNQPLCPEDKPVPTLHMHPWGRSCLRWQRKVA